MVRIISQWAVGYFKAENRRVDGASVISLPSVSYSF